MSARGPVTMAELEAVVEELRASAFSHGLRFTTTDYDASSERAGLASRTWGALLYRIEQQGLDAPSVRAVV